MGKTKNATKPLTQEEIWDDSALVRNWDEAVEEYKLYHSVHAKGEDIEDVLREADAEDTGKLAGHDEQQGHEQRMETDVETPAVVPPVIPVDAEPDAGHGTTQPLQSSQENPTPGTGTGTGTAPVSAMPMPPVLSSVQDERLKNLMMSWYFAGYYTGLYEGQQKGNQNGNS